jgi:hypothetical protein
LRDAGFEVVREAGDRAVVLAPAVGNDAGREFACNGSVSARRLRSGFEVRPDILRNPNRAWKPYAPPQQTFGL